MSSSSESSSDDASSDGSSPNRSRRFGGLYEDGYGDDDDAGVTASAQDRARAKERLNAQVLTTVDKLVEHTVAQHNDGMPAGGLRLAQAWTWRRQILCRPCT